MGLSNSREMDDMEIISDENTDTDTDGADLDAILGLLIRSGQVRFLGTDRYFGPSAEDNRVPKSSMEELNKNDIAFQTRSSSGLVTPQGNRRIRTVTQMLLHREIGQGKGVSFSRSQKCNINNQRIPRTMRVVDTYDHKAFCGIFSPDGTKLLTACQDRFMRVYDVTNGAKYKEVACIAGRDVGWSILDVAFSPSANSIAYTSWSSNIHLLELQCGRSEPSHQTALALCPEERRFCIFCLQFSSDGNEILCGANDGHMYIYDMASKTSHTYSVDAHGDDVNAVSFADQTSQIIYSGSDDGFCKVWDRRTLSETSPKPVGVLAGHLQGITYIDSRGDARYFISNSKDQSIKLWDIRMFSNSDAQESTKKLIGNSKWDYRWQEAPKSYKNHQKIKGDTSVATYRGHSVLQTLIRCHFSPAYSTGQRYIYSGDAHGRLIVFDVLTGVMKLQLTGHTSCVRDVSWHPYRPEIVTTSWDFSVVCWNNMPVYDSSENVDDLVDGNDPNVKQLRGWKMHHPLRRSPRLARVQSGCMR